MLFCCHINNYMENEENFTTNIKTTKFAPFSKFLTKYTLIRKLNYGANSKVFLISRKKDNVLFVCKRIFSNCICDEEWAIPNSIDSDRIIKIIEKYTNVVGGIRYTYLIMNYFKDSIDTFDYIRNLNITKESDLKPIVLEMVKAIKDTHDAGYIHMDIKFENFLIISLTPIKIILIDFEFSRAIDSQSQRVCGTKNYMAPEVHQCMSTKKSDIYSLGCIIYYVITSECYSNTIDCKNYMNNVLKKQITEDLFNLIKGCLSYKTDLRFDIDDVIDHPWFQLTSAPIPIITKH
jgi:serine/threonine protein kinase